MSSGRFFFRSATIQMTIKGPFVLDDDDTVLSIFCVIRSQKEKWVAWLPMILFTLDDQKILSLSSSANFTLVNVLIIIFQFHAFRPMCSYFDVCKTRNICC